MPNVKQEKRIISEWVKIQKKLGIEIQDPEWHDSQSSGDIEAIASPFAIEHTSVDRFEDQRHHEANFKAVVQDLNQIKIMPLARIKISLEFDDFSKINHKSNFNKLREALIIWLHAEVSKLPNGYTQGTSILDMPVGWRSWKYSDRPSGLYFGLSVDTEKYEKEIGSLLRRKANKLETYRRQGYTTVVIVENNDFQLMAPDVFLKMVVKTHVKNKLFIDQLWFADTSLDDIEFWQIDLESKQLCGPYSLWEQIVSV